MYMLSQNPNGGVPLQKPKLEEDPETGTLCLKFGYCPNCKYEQKLRSVEARRYFAEMLGINYDEFIRVKRPLRQKIGEYLIKTS